MEDVARQALGVHADVLRTTAGAAARNSAAVASLSPSGVVAPSTVPTSAMIAPAVTARVRSSVLGEGGDIVVGRGDEDVLGAADLHDPAVAHHGDPVAEPHGLVQVVGDEDDGLLQRLLQLQQLVLHIAADQRVERAEGLVHQQQIGVGGQRAGQAHALLHTAGQLVGPGLLPALEPGEFERFGGAPMPLGARYALHFEAVGGVLQHTAVREEREVLEDHGDLLGADLAQLLVAERGEVLAVEADGSRRSAPAAR